MTTLWAFIVVIGVLIVAHELGHYWAARWCGVKVLRFSIGFGKPLFSWKVGADRTEWAVAAFPLGGYVKMLDETEGEVAPEELKRAFNRQTVGKRMFIVAAGPLANFALAILLYWFFFVHGFVGLRAVVAEPPPASPAAMAGLRNGDVVSAVGGEPVAAWQDLRWQLLRQAVEGGVVPLTVKTGQGSEATRQLDVGTLSPDEMDGDVLGKLGLLPFQPVLEAVIGELVPGGVGMQAGLLRGDKVAAVNGKAVYRWEELVRSVQEHPGQPLVLDILRKGQRLSITVVPARVEEKGRVIGRIGAAPWVDQRMVESLFVEVSYPAHVALAKAVAKTWDMSAFSLEMLGRMVVGQVSLKNISGPLTIADYAGQSARSGWFPFLSFLALISISLGVLNLLPVPLLDGGHLMYYIAELIKGSPVSEKTMAVGQQVGMALLALLMVFAFYNDINRLIAY
ncbi:MAG: RIP metalloprotease RseP [Sulfuricellaceae bacterium]|jgi:regulator of sigma E protease